MADAGITPPTFNARIVALRFFFGMTCGREEMNRCLPFRTQPRKLPLEASGVDLTNELDVAALDAVFDRVAERDIPVLMHVADEFGGPLDSERFASLAGILTSHPKVRVAHAHCAGHVDDGTIEFWLRVRGSGYDPQTSYVDVSACLTFHSDAPLAQRELMVWRLRKWGIDHVLFGSDYFIHDGATPKEALETLANTPSPKRNSTRSSPTADRTGYASRHLMPSCIRILALSPEQQPRSIHALFMLRCSTTLMQRSIVAISPGNIPAPPWRIRHDTADHRRRIQRCRR